MIDYEFVRGETETISYTIDVNLFYVFSAGTSLKRDINLGHTISRSLLA
ncbi:MAG: hypothetical protein JSW15_11875 [Deltaproteobacteria bacterium]|nr:MAG: hypothetical protein JSW15_11875 [Deltaproteobacteria bacterium]